METTQSHHLIRIELPSDFKSNCVRTLPLGTAGTSAISSRRSEIGLGNQSLTVAFRNSVRQIVLSDELGLRSRDDPNLMEMRRLRVLRSFN
jgi:hypothetical protein